MVESVGNVLIGYGIAVAAQVIVFPWFGVNISLQANLLIGAIFTVVSIARSYLLRRLFEFLHIRVPLSPALLAIAAERRRQIDTEGWTPEHDDDHKGGELARAGAAYAWVAGYRHPYPPSCWPWEREWWKPQDKRRDLVRAGALIVAEIERFERSRKRRRAEGPVKHAKEFGEEAA